MESADACPALFVVDLPYGQGNAAPQQLAAMQFNQALSQQQQPNMFAATGAYQQMTAQPQYGEQQLQQWQQAQAGYAQYQDYQQQQPTQYLQDQAAYAGQAYTQGYTVADAAQAQVQAHTQAQLAGLFSCFPLSCALGPS